MLIPRCIGIASARSFCIIAYLLGMFLCCNHLRKEINEKEKEKKDSS